MSECNCRVCKRSRKFESILRKYDMDLKDLNYMRDIMTSLMTAELDRDCALADLDDLQEKTETERTENESTEN